MKKIGISQFFKSNTPKIYQIIGDISLTLATIGTAIIAFPSALESSGIAGFVMPTFLLTVAKYCLAFGSVIKFITKFIGEIQHPTEIKNETNSK